MPATDVEGAKSVPHSVKDLAAALGAGFGTSGVRGKVVDLTPELCHAYTHAFLEQTQCGSGLVLIGHDLRPSSPHIAAYCRQLALQ
jgi:phosphomannomutase